MSQRLRFWQRISPTHSLTGSLISLRSYFPTGSVFLSSISVGILLAALFPAVSFASVVSQTDNSANGNNLNYLGTLGYFWQSLGIISGTITSVELQYVATTTAPAGNFAVYMYSCPPGLSDNAALYPLTNCVSESATTTVLSSQGAGTYQVNSVFSSPVVASTTGRTVIVVQWNTLGNSNRALKGCAVSCYANGTGAFGHPDTPNTGLADWYFVVNGAVGYSAAQSEGITSQTSPTNNSTTANNTPLFAYTYYITHGYDRASFILRDITSGLSIDTRSASSTINASGSGSYSNYFGVTSGHLYEWQPIVYSTTGIYPTLYGKKYSFFAVTTNQYQSLPEDVENPFSSSAIYSTGWTSSTSTGIVASSSVDGRTYYSVASTTALNLCFGYFPDGLRNQMAIKFPFSYVCDMQTLLMEMINGDGNESGDLVLTYPTVLGHDLATSTTLINKSAIAQIQAVQTVKTVTGYAIYLMTALGIMWAIFKVI